MASTLTKTRKEFNEVTSLIKSRHPEIYSLLSISPETVSELSLEKNLPKNTLFIEYFPTNKETYLFLISESDLIVKRVSIGKQQLNELVALFRDLIYENRNTPIPSWNNGAIKEDNNIKKLKETSLILYRHLVGPIQDEIRETKTLALIPFGSFNYLPFNALARETDDGGLRFLIEEKELVYLVSTSTDYIRLITHNSGNPEIGGLAAFGNPDLGEPELLLPHSEEEVLKIKETFPNATIFLKEQATKANFRKSWETSEVIHLAAHGLIQKEPSILLAPLGSGSLTLSDITGLPTGRRKQLVVLSVCDAAIAKDGLVKSKAELNSIAFAFTVVGVPSVVATLWKVNDRATAVLMEDFYKNLKDTRKFDYRTLRKAQLDMLHGSDRYSQPFYWAPFILVGLWE